jgi:hypothetical protein
MGLFGAFKKSTNDKTAEAGWKAFIEEYRPETGLVKPSEHILQACKKVGFPEELLDFQKQYGFGNYGKGILKLIDPEEYMNSLYTWLGGEDFSKIPFMMTGFGDIFYYRNLEDGNYDIALLDIHYRQVIVPAYSIEELWKYLLSEDSKQKFLRKSLFDNAVDKCGLLENDDIYFFVPALVAGGAENIKYVDKGKAAVHHQVLFQLGS